MPPRVSVALLRSRDSSSAIEAGVRKTVTSAPRKSASLTASGANRRGALHIHVQQHIAPLAKALQDLAFRGAVAMAVDDGVLQKTALRHPPRKAGTVNKIIIRPVALAPRAEGGWCR